jgi:hypothetical protein
MIYKILIVCAFCAGLALIVFTDPRAESLRDAISKTTNLPLQ